MQRDTYVIIPVYNESAKIAEVVTQVKKNFQNIVCVDDGSRDSSAREISKSGARLVRHAINQGQGAALQTGIEYALQDPEAKYFITFDADGQHSLSDALTMLDYIRRHKVDIVLGSRFLGEVKNISQMKKVVLKLAVLFSNTTTGVRLTDAHNGLRVLNRHAAENINITMSGFAHASEIIHRIADLKLRYAELPVTITYTDYSKAKGHNPLMNAVNISFDLLLNKISKK